MAKVDQGAVQMAQLWRGGLLESTHFGHIVVADASGVIAAWGNPEAVIFPRSSCKMIQALPLIESGAAARFGLSQAQLALSCASHQGAALHIEHVSRWLADLGLGDDDLRCGAHEPSDRAERERLIRTEAKPCQCHNNCSGKHAGFLTANKHLGAGPEYIEIDHPLQKAIRAATEEVTGEDISGWGIDGCSAPNFAFSLGGLAKAMASFANAHKHSGKRADAMAQLAQAMIAYPELVAGETRACTELMRAAKGRAALKTGAEGVFIGILPDLGLGVALKALDGNSRAAEAMIAGLLVKYGLLDTQDPLVQRRLNPVQKNWRGFETGEFRLSNALL